MKVIVLGGTGFLGFHSIQVFLQRGHTVNVLALPDIEIGDWFPGEVSVAYGDVFTMTEDELQDKMTAYDALVYALGPDDRVTPRSPAYEFFHKFLVDECGKALSAARKAGVKRCVVLNSYFCYFDRLWPEKRLAERHPYIKCRVEQAERAFLEGGDTMETMILELPYIFGAMPERAPLWKDVLFERLRLMKTVFFPTGGTAMISVEHVGEAVAGAIEFGKAGERYTVGDENMTWKEMLRIMLDAMGMLTKKIVTLPTFLVSLYGKKLRNDDFKLGKESGLNHALLFKDIQSQFMYVDPSAAVEALKYKLGGVKEAIVKTVEACYPKPAR